MRAGDGAYLNHLGSQRDSTASMFPLPELENTIAVSCKNIERVPVVR